MKPTPAEISPIGGKAVARPMTRAEAEACCEQIRAHIDAARVLVLELYDREGWKALGYGSWRECAVAQFDRSKSHLYRQLEAAHAEREVEPDGAIGTIPERQLRPLAAVPPGARKPIWDESKATAPNGRMTAKHVEETRDRVAPPPVKPAPAPAPKSPAPRPSPADVEALDAAIEQRADRPAIPDDPDGSVEFTRERVGPAPEDDDGRGDLEGEKSDAELLALCPARAALGPGCLEGFDRDAILFYRVRDLRLTLQAGARPAIKEARGGGRKGLYEFTLVNFLNFPDPIHWRVCGQCEGDGTEPPLSYCHACYGRGYTK